MSDERLPCPVCGQLTETVGPLAIKWSPEAEAIFTEYREDYGTPALARIRKCAEDRALRLGQIRVLRDDVIMGRARHMGNVELGIPLRDGMRGE